MFKNNVFKVSVSTQKWFKASIIRSIRTMSFTALSTIGVATAMNDVNWIAVGSTALVSGIITMLTCISGLPEVGSEEK